MESPAWTGFGRVLSGSANDRVWRTERKRGNGFEFLCYHGGRKRLALELEGQSDTQAVQEERVREMDGTNPRVILRNYIAQNAIEAAENGDFSEVSIGFASFFLGFFSSLHFSSSTPPAVVFTSTSAGPAGPQSSREAVLFAAGPGVSCVAGRQRRGCKSGGKRRRRRAAAGGGIFIYGQKSGVLRQQAPGLGRRDLRHMILVITSLNAARILDGSAQGSPPESAHHTR